MSEWFGTASAGMAEWNRHPASQPGRDWCSSRVNSRLAEAWQWPSEVVDDCRDAMPQDVEACFRKLADEWSRDVGNVSSIAALTSHPKYKEIIDLGWDVVPYLLSDLQQNKRFWFPALHEITKIRPFDPSDAGNSRRMTEAWVKWGQKRFT